ncbi:MAG: mannosyltransferase [Acidimicrobiaceae bacterium]|nr:mannosyltransferase [Acidimicrobiaceae bacterium]
MTLSTSEPHIRLDKVARTYRLKDGREIEALVPTDLSIGVGEFVSIVGPSGCGKSTLLRIVGGLVAPSDGQVVIGHADSTKPLCAMVFQEYSIFPWRTVRANVGLGLEAMGVRKKELHDRVSFWLDRVNLSAFEDVYPRNLSGGMKQRVALARALAMEPEILLMDEPFAALDPQLRTLMQEQLVRICEEERRTVLFVTHSLDEAITLSDRVVVMTARPGRVKVDLPIPLPRPRQADVGSDPAFHRLRTELWTQLREEVELAVQAAESDAVMRDG